MVPRPANVLRLGMELATRHQPGGVALASKTGESMDLRGVRPYRKGDRIRDLSARTWARTGKPAVREYQEEYFTRVGVVLDCVAPRTRSARSEEAFEAAVSLTAGVVAHLGRGDALVDLLVTGGEIHALTLGRSLGFLEQALDHLAGPSVEANVDRNRLLERLAPHLARLSAVVMIVDGWDEAREAFVRGVEKSGVRVHAIAVGAPSRARASRSSPSPRSSRERGSSCDPAPARGAAARLRDAAARGGRGPLLLAGRARGARPGIGRPALARLPHHVRRAASG